MKIEFGRRADMLEGHLGLYNTSGPTKRGISAFGGAEGRKSVLPEATSNIPENSLPKDFRISLVVIYDVSKHSSFLIASLQGES